MLLLTSHDVIDIDDVVFIVIDARLSLHHFCPGVKVWQRERSCHWQGCCRVLVNLPYQPLTLLILAILLDFYTLLILQKFIVVLLLTVLKIAEIVIYRVEFLKLIPVHTILEI